MVSLLDTVTRKRVTRAADQRKSATLLSIRQNLVYRASVGIDDIDAFKSHLPDTTVDALMSRVRQLLNTEFGRLRVHRYRQVYTVGHHCLEGLIGGLLRVQFHARLIEMPRRDEGLVFRDSHGLALSWGVGDSIIEADIERLRRRRLKP